jgi:hypothetical protein
MSNKVVLVLTRVEADHVLALFLNERDDGTYWGPVIQHHARQERIIKKLEALLTREDPTT